MPTKIETENFNSNKIKTTEIISIYALVILIMFLISLLLWALNNGTFKDKSTQGAFSTIGILAMIISVLFLFAFSYHLYNQNIKNKSKI